MCTGPHTSDHLFRLDSGDGGGEINLRSFGNVKISDLDFADEAVIFVQTGYLFGDPRGAE